MVPAWFEPPLCDPAKVMGWIAREAVDAAMLRRLKSNPEIIAELSGHTVASVKKWHKCGHTGSEELKKKFRERFGLDWYCGHLYEMFGNSLAPR